MAGKTWAAKGKTPVVLAPGQRQSVNAASAVSATGAFWFATYHGALTGGLFVELLKKLMWRRKQPLNLVLDGLPAHKTKRVHNYVASTKGRLSLRILPGYAPDPNPDKLIWSHAKRRGNARRPLQQGEKFDERVLKQLADVGDNRGLVRSFSLSTPLSPTFLTDE